MATLAPNTSTELEVKLPKDATYDPVDMPPFDPAIHLAFKEPSARHSFTELGLTRPKSAPDMCITEPFQLFSDEGVRMIRRDLLRKEVLDKHMQSWVRAPCTIGSHEDVATWINIVWNHPATIECVSKAFGLPLKPLGRKGETGYCNVQLGPDGPAGVYKLGEVPSGPLDASTTSGSEFDKVMTDTWHRDSTQIACVVMLSDTSTMEGGETAIRIGDGSILKARGAKMGGAVLIQGAHLTHAALRATNAPERISMVTSFAFADTRLDDSGTSLRSVDILHPAGVGIQNHFLLHKLRRLQENVKNAIDQVEAADAAKESPKRDEVEPWVEEQITLLKQTSWELFERYPNYLYKDIPENAIREYMSHI
ncbi:hypothetical protein VTL71DRAFT_9041 [Oculimacula yallundae]|uniref:Uncharacterized protein n=1 Tax=Oculimacula yallundae TaxID=86028 RepID=A0ABR4BTL7_9HELO